MMPPLTKGGIGAIMNKNTKNSEKESIFMNFAVYAYYYYYYYFETR